MANNSYRAVDYQGGNQDDVYDFGWREGFNEGRLEAFQTVVDLIEGLPEGMAWQAVRVVLNDHLEKAKAQVDEDNEGLSEYE